MILKTKAELQAERDAKIRSKQTRYNTSKLAIVYVRQSGSNAPTENRESREAQLDDLFVLAADEYAWTESQIVTIDENSLDKRGDVLEKPRGVSGRYGSDTRAGLRILEERIEKDEVGIIFIREPSRLFRDVDRDAAPGFAKLCKQKHVIIVTPFAEYDMNITSRDDYKAFLDATAAAGEELKTIYRRMHLGRERKGLRGEYAGTAIPAGYTLSGEDYIPLPSWAEVITHLSKRYRELDGCLSGLFNEVRGKAIFPELPAGVTQHVPLRHIEGGYTITSQQSLGRMLCNPSYRGHRVFKQRIVKRDAHEPLISKEDYEYALSRLGQVDLEGNGIEQPKRVRRFTQEHTKRKGLLSGTRADGRAVVESSTGSVYIFQTAHYVGYSIRDTRSLLANPRSGGISIDAVDEAVSERLEAKLKQLVWHATVERDLGGSQEYGAQAILSHVAKLKQQVGGNLGKLNESIKDVEKTIARKVRDYEVAGDVMSSEDVREHYASLARLRSRLADLKGKQKQVSEADADIEAVASRFNRAAQEWESMSLEQKRSFVRIITTSITLDVLSGRWMKLAMTWHPVLAGENYTEVAIFMKSHRAASNYASHEDDILREMYPQLPRSDILAALPARSWQSVQYRASTLKIHRSVKSEEAAPLFFALSQRDICLMNDYGITAEQVFNGQNVWWIDTINCESRK